MSRRLDEEGVSVVSVILVMLLIAAMGQVLVSMVGTENFSTVHQMQSSQAHYIAESGIERAKFQYANGTACAALTYNDTLGAGSYATTGTLYNPASTTLSAAIAAVGATIPVASIAGYAPHGRVRIEAEDIDYSNLSAVPADCAPFAQPCLTGAQRGVKGTTAAAHVLGTAVAQNQCLIRSTGTVAGAPAAQRVIEAGVSSGGGASSTVQSGAATSTANGTLTVPIPTAVAMSRAFLIFSTRHDSNRPVGSMVRGRIATPTTLQFVRVTNEGTPVPITIQWQVVEFASGVNVQRGELNQNGATNNVPIAPVASLSQAFVTWSKTSANTDTDWGDNDPILGELTTASNLQFRANGAYPAHVIGWQVIEFTNPADVLVQKGSTNALNGGALSTTVTLPTPVDVNKTFVLAGFRTAGTGADVGDRMLRAQLLNSNTIFIDRSTGDTGDPITEIVWQAVQLNNSRVQRGSQNFPAGGTPQIVVTLAGNVDVINAGAVSIAGAAAGAPEAVAGNSGVNQGIITTTINTLSNNAWLVDIVGAGDTGAFDPVAGQTERWENSGNGTVAAMSTKPVAAAGPTSMTGDYTSGNTDRIVHVVAAIARNIAATPIVYDAQSNNRDTNTNTLSWPHVIGSGANRKLLVGVTVEEESPSSGDEDVLSVTYGGAPLSFAGEASVVAGGGGWGGGWGGGGARRQHVELWYLDEADMPAANSFVQIVPIAAVDPSRAIAFASVQPVGGQNMGRSPYNGDDVIGVGSVTMALGPNQIVMQRDNAADTADIGWFVVEFGQSGGGMIDWRELF